jgi:hypothetical protein
MTDSLDTPCSGDRNRHRVHFYRGQTPSLERRIQNTEGSDRVCGVFAKDGGAYTFTPVVQS